MTSLRRMCASFKRRHHPFLERKTERDLEHAIVFAGHRVRSLFDGIMVQNRVSHIDNVTCSAGASVARNVDANHLIGLITEAMHSLDAINEHLLDLADAWTLTQTKESDLVEEVISSLAYFRALKDVAAKVTEPQASLRLATATPTTLDAACEANVRGWYGALRSIPEGVPNWTHLKVGVEMLLSQCNLDPSLRDAAEVNGDL